MPEQGQRILGVTMYSPKYKDKARRLINSCERVGVCCKATVLPPNVFGPDAPEGSENFRFRAIAIKPAFILSQLRTTQLPVVYLDSDLEFHRYPELFQPGSWPNGDRDVIVFNFWANETNITIRSIPNTASGVIYFNQTFNAQKVLIAWAEAMAYEKNVKAPDDQVLDVLLVNGWLERASYGWLPSSYLRIMPAYYRGVRAVIDHDHGNAPGIAGHSSDKAVLPPVAGLEKLQAVSGGIKCVATMEGGSDDWCTNSCNDPSGITNPSATTCPTKLCVCDWKGEWPVEDTGEVNWDDTKSLGVGGDSPSPNSEDAAIARAVAKSLGAVPENQPQRRGHIRGPNGAEEASRTSFRQTAREDIEHETFEESTSSADSADSTDSGSQRGASKHGPKWIAKYGEESSRARAAASEHSAGTSRATSVARASTSMRREHEAAGSQRDVSRHGPKWIAKYGEGSVDHSLDGGHGHGSVSHSFDAGHGHGSGKSSRGSARHDSVDAAS